MCSINTCLLHRPPHGHGRPGTGKGPTLPGRLLHAGTMEGALQTLDRSGGVRGLQFPHEKPASEGVTWLPRHTVGNSDETQKPRRFHHPERRVLSAVTGEAPLSLQHSRCPSRLVPDIYQQGQPRADCRAGTATSTFWEAVGCEERMLALAPGSQATRGRGVHTTPTRRGPRPARGARERPCPRHPGEAQ